MACLLSFMSKMWKINTAKIANTTVLHFEIALAAELKLHFNYMQNLVRRNKIRILAELDFCQLELLLYELALILI